MNTKTFLSLAALAALPTVGFGQYSGGAVWGISDPGSVLLHADIGIAWSSTSVTVTVQNLTDAGDTFIDPLYSIETDLVAFYILKPVLTTATFGDADGDPLSATPVADDDGEWKHEQEARQLSNIPGIDNTTKDYYFGGSNQNVPGIVNSPETPTSLTFTFDIVGWDGSTLGAHYADLPKVLVRYRSIDLFYDNVLDNRVNGASGKGWEGSGFEDSVVPEPSAIAALAALGLGGLLMVRRRLIRQQK